MQINYKTPVLFKSKNVEIRKADRVLRNMQNVYPSVSTTRYFDYSVVKYGGFDILGKFKNIAQKLNRIRLKRMYVGAEDYLNSTINDVKNYKLANCGELAIMAKGAFLANGYKDLNIANLFVKHDFCGEELIEDMDHCFLILNAGEKADFNNLSTFDKRSIIVDPWCGFVDYLNSGLTRFKELFLDEDEQQTVKWIFKKTVIPHSDMDTCKKLKIEHPEFIV